MKNKKVLYIVLGALDAALTIFLFVISIIMLIDIQGKDKIDIMETPGLIGFLEQNPTIYLVAFVIPIFILLGVNIFVLYRYIKKSSSEEKKPVKVNELTDEQKEALKAELLKDLAAASKKDEEKK